MFYYDLLKNIMKNGSVISPRGHETKELANVTLTMISPHSDDVTGQRLRLPEGCGNFICSKHARSFEKAIMYEFNELSWYFSTNRESKVISEYATLWKDIKNSDNTANSNYGYLVFRQRTNHPSLPNSLYPTMNGFKWAVHSLEKSDITRQAVITYNDGSYNYEENNDYICTQCQMFLIRNNQLHCTVPLRSSDAIYGLTFNMAWWSVVQQKLRFALLGKYPNLTLGNIVVNIQSAHIYKKHYNLVEKMLDEPREEYFLELIQDVPIGKTMKWYQDNINSFIKIHRLI